MYVSGGGCDGNRLATCVLPYGQGNVTLSRTRPLGSVLTVA